MIFLRTTSYAFGTKKSCTFRHNLQQSFQFGSHRAVIADSAFSYYGLYTAGYTFMPVKEAGPIDRWLNQEAIDYNKVAESLFAGIGLVEASYNFDGSGDSGDFNEDAISWVEGLNMGDAIGLLNSKGLLDSTNPNHCLHMRNPARREWRKDVLIEIRGGTRTAADTIECTAQNALEDEYGGWENNAGANGTVSFTQSSKVNIDYNPGTYSCDRCGEEYDDESDCDCLKCPECGDYVDEDTNKCECCDEVVSICNNELCNHHVLGENKLCRYCKEITKAI